MQDPAAQALRDGLVKFGGAGGWKDLGMTIDLSKDWAGQLDRAPVGTGFPDWLKAVVLSKSDGAATVGFTNGSRGTLPVSGASMPVRGVGGRAFDSLKPGMVVIVKQTASRRLSAEVGPLDLGRNAGRGGPHRPRPRDAGRIRRHRLQLQSRDPGASAARLGVQADRLCDRAPEWLHASDDRARCALLRRSRRRVYHRSASSTSTGARRGRTRYAGASNSRAT